MATSWLSEGEGRMGAGAHISKSIGLDVLSVLTVGEQDLDRDRPSPLQLTLDRHSVVSSRCWLPSKQSFPIHVLPRAPASSAGQERVTDPLEVRVRPPS